MHQAAKTGDIAAIKVAIEGGEDVNAIDDSEFKCTALHYATEGDHKKIAELLVKAGADVNIETNAQYTALHLAALNNCDDTGKLLIDSGANLDPYSNDGCTPLHFAIMYHSLEMTRLLIESGADLNALTKSDGVHAVCTPLELAKQNTQEQGSANRQIQYLLKKNGALTQDGC
jgi:cytochrome c